MNDACICTHCGQRIVLSETNQWLHEDGHAYCGYTTDGDVDV